MLYHAMYKTSYYSSLGHMVLLSMVRYLITVHPLQSRRHLTTLAVTLWSVTVWILSFILLLFEVMFIRYIGISQVAQEENRAQQKRLQAWRLNIVSLLTVLFPFCTILILHCLKMKSLRSSPGSVETKRKMNLIITVILSVFLIFQIVTIVEHTMYLLYAYTILHWND
jgi:hypothetical protein